MKRFLSASLLGALAFGLMAWPAVQAGTHLLPPVIAAQPQSSNASTPAKKPKKEKKAKAQKGGGVSFYEGSGETRAERDKRLTRECKGRPNAGLCQGYANP